MAINHNPIWNLIRQDVKNFGVIKTLYDITFRVINRFLFFKVLRCMIIDSVDPHYLGSNNGYQFTFLGRDTLLAFTENKEYELSEEFVWRALKKGDECYGILDGPTLASYGWYSSKPTEIAFGPAKNGGEDLRLHFSGEYVYMYSGYTHDRYRGQRLHAIGMTRALEEYLGKGFKGLVSYVESNNYSSLKSVYRMGYKDFGKVYVLRIFGKHIIRSSKGCEKYQFRVKAH
jgi:hypothetical protein